MTDKSSDSDGVTIADEVAASAGLPGVLPASIAAMPDTAEITEAGEPALRKMPAWQLTLLVLANFGASMAYIVPLAYSLALQINRLAPGQPALLGIAIGISSTVIVITGPLMGLWSDRTRSRLGRRRPFMIVGIVIGLAALLTISLATNVVVVMLLWTVANFGWGLVLSAVQAIQADRLPDRQRGKASGLIGMTGQIAPIIGISLASLLHGDVVLIFMIPAIAGAVLIVLFLLFGGEGSSKNLVLPADKLSVRRIFGAYVFNPRKHPDFGWNLLGRFLFFLGLYGNTTYSTFFYSQRLHVSIENVAGVAAAVGFLGVVAGAVGAVGGGFISDKLGRRRLFTAIGALLFAAGAVVEAFSWSFVMLMAGSLLMNLAIAAFSAVDQAIVIAVLPDRKEAGRFMGIIAFAMKIPSAVAPLLGSILIGIGAAAGQANYTFLYLLGGVFALAGGLIIFFKVKAVR